MMDCHTHWNTSSLWAVKSSPIRFAPLAPPFFLSHSAPSPSLLPHTNPAPPPLPPVSSHCAPSPSLHSTVEVQRRIYIVTEVKCVLASVYASVVFFSPSSLFSSPSISFILFLLIFFLFFLVSPPFPPPSPPPPSSLHANSQGVLDLLANRCLAQGTNAWTDVDHTCYTVSTAGSEGFLNLLPIYLEHVLYPTLTVSGNKA